MQSLALRRKKMSIHLSNIIDNIEIYKVHVKYKISEVMESGFSIIAE